MHQSIIDADGNETASTQQTGQVFYWLRLNSTKMYLQVAQKVTTFLPTVWLPGKGCVSQRVHAESLYPFDRLRNV